MTHFILINEVIEKQDFIKLYMREVLKHYRLLNNFVSNRGRLFNNELMKDLCKKAGVVCNLSTVYHSESNEQTENLNQTLKQYL